MPKRFSIDDYFAEARDREEAPLLHSNQVASLLEQRGTQQHKTRKHTTAHRSWFAPSLTIGFATAVLAVILLWPSATAPTNQGVPPIASNQQPIKAQKFIAEPLTDNLPTYSDTIVVESISFAPDEQPLERQTGALAIPVVASMATPQTIAHSFSATHLPRIAQMTTNTLRLHPATLVTTAVVGPALITLTKQQLARLGILFDNGKAFYHDVAEPHLERVAQQLQISATQLAALIREQNININAFSPLLRIAIRTNGIGSTEQGPSQENTARDNVVAKAAITPHLVSIYHRGVLTASYWNRRDDDMVQKLRSVYKQLGNITPDTAINRLVPIHFQLKDANNSWFPQADVVLWYSASAELAEALPEPDRERLLAELAPKKTEAASSGRQYFDSWRTTSGAITATAIYPNPVRGDKATLRYTLREQRTTTVALHDIFGRQIVAVQSEEHPAGNYEVELPLRNLENGMYLVVLTTDNNEQAVQRLLLQR